ncbi:hypothetical protein BLNAU_7175 [Blattamonas nauphoetae]|uniref:Uncharacterized protein n=1 Tax=Blattamonas nauphoetae TaxID=2049346 RepID=A0ABQ9Y1Y4_9EUKA|nr:hypothetical protein BLNAU_7175 [Blattamonas nauphoetae]
MTPIHTNHPNSLSRRSEPVQIPHTHRVLSDAQNDPCSDVAFSDSSIDELKSDCSPTLLPLLRLQLRRHVKLDTRLMSFSSIRNVRLASLFTELDDLFAIVVLIAESGLNTFRSESNMRSPTPTAPPSVQPSPQHQPITRKLEVRRLRSGPIWKTDDSSSNCGRVSVRHTEPEIECEAAMVASQKTHRSRLSQMIPTHLCELSSGVGNPVIAGADEQILGSPPIVQKCSLSPIWGENELANIALFQEIRTVSLESHIQRLSRGDECVSWTTLMEWFVEAVIGAELFRSEHASTPPLSMNDVRIDSSSTVLIAPHSVQQESPIAGSLSSDISTLCRFFLRIHRTLEHENRLIIPVDPKQEYLVFARIMLALIDYFVASGDLILQLSSRTDQLQILVDSYFKLGEIELLLSNPFLPRHLAYSFTIILRLPRCRQFFIPTNHSFLCGNADFTSDELLEAVKQINEHISMEIVQREYCDWKEWVTMMEMVEEGVVSLSDLSFLQSRCLRASLLSLQTKHQHIVNPTQIREDNQTDSTPFRPTRNASELSSRAVDVTSVLNDVGSSLLSPSISTQTSLPSQHSSSDSQILTSDQLLFHSDSVVHHSRHLLSAIQLHLTRHHPTSFTWDIRQSIRFESALVGSRRLKPQLIDQNERFDTSLFAETDDHKLVASLIRCRDVVKATKSTKCIVNVHNFRSFVFAGLTSSNSAIQLECFNLFRQIGDLLPTVDDPRSSRFVSLRTAFYDGTNVEKDALFQLWERWLSFRHDEGQKKIMNETDFDFNAFLTTDLSNKTHFLDACCFVWMIYYEPGVSMSFQWKLDFLLQFEKRHKMMLRVSRLSRIDLNYLTVHLGSVLSVFRGCDFPSALTELIAADSDPIKLQLSRTVNPAVFLCHTSIAPNHRHSFFQMDLVFERFLRDDPDAFFTKYADPILCTSRKFLFTPYVGLHSLLLRSPVLNLDKPGPLPLLTMLYVETDPGASRLDIIDLFAVFPPPRLVDIVFSSPKVVQPTSDIWLCFLIFARDFATFAAPFGACSSLAKLFKMLAPFDLNPKQDVLDVLWVVGEIVVSLHWLNFPAHFDPPHLPSSFSELCSARHPPNSLLSLWHPFSRHAPRTTHI